MLELSAKNGLRDVILGSEEKNVGFGSALFTQFWRCKYGCVHYSFFLFFSFFLNLASRLAEAMAREKGNY